MALHTLPGAERALLGALESTVQTLGPRIPPKRLTTLDDLAATSVSRPRLQTMLLSMFSAVALLLGAVGVYGVVSFGVNQRKREICMRMALGASPATLHGMILRQMLLPLTLGVTLGILGIVMISRIATAWMTAATPDPGWTAAVTGFLCVVVLGATVLPTTRATRTVLSQGLRM